MVKTVLYAEKLYDDDKVEREVFGSDVRVVWRNVANLSQLEERDCAEVDGPVTVIGDDPHGLDRDGDKQACEN